ncbi:hypothetical protein D7M15_14545 [Streptomyces sp. Z26]|nr:hypothetical protein D7M15_14545 [Streptomyces sp. Z26]
MYVALPQGPAQEVEHLLGPRLGGVRAIFEGWLAASDAVRRKAEDRPRTGSYVDDSDNAAR